MKILYISSESAPFVKTGGLGDVASSLPKKLNLLNIKTDVFMPKFLEVSNNSNYNNARLYLTGHISLKNQSILYKIFTLKFNHINYYFLDIPFYFNRSKGVYGYHDDYERFAAFSVAALDFLEAEKYDIAHCNDWHSGLVPFLLKENNSSIKSVFNIHHMGFQGLFSLSKYRKLNLPAPNKILGKGILKRKQINYLRAGIDFADTITLDSDTYKKEVLNTDLGCNLQDRLNLRKNDLHSIRNGIDYEIFNPITDREIFFNYDTNNFVLGKKKNNNDLREKFGLPINETPVIAMVTRMTEQKGFSILNPIIEELVKMFDFQLVLIGSGDKKIEAFYQKLTKRYPKNVVFYSFSSTLANIVYAGSDMFLMPSRFEPCGLAQLIAIKYGTVPVVRNTGGLSETKHENYCFKFQEYNSNELKDIIVRAINTFKDKDLWYDLIKTGMLQDFSWDRNVLHYIDLYRNLVK